VWAASPGYAGIPYTVSVWALVSAAWVHRVTIFDGSSVTQYEDGVAGSYSWNHQLNASGNLAIAPAVASDIDDVVILPFAVPASWVASWPTSTAFPSRPNVLLSGDCVAYPRTVQGEKASIGQKNHGSSGLFGVFSCDLREV